MKEFKGTPGPWSWENHPYHGVRIGLTGGNDTDVLLATGSMGVAWIVVGGSDARAIAAVPEMIAFALDVSRNYDHEGVADGYCYPSCRRCKAETILANALGT